MDIKFYTWKDVERYFLTRKDIINTNEYQFNVYPTYILIGINEEIQSIDEKKCHKHLTNILKELFFEKYDEDNQCIHLDIDGQYLKIITEFIDGIAFNTKAKSDIIPLFKEVVYRDSVDNSHLEPLKGVQVISFHSYKGGVGRTLCLLTFAKAWTNIFSKDTQRRKLLIIDSDLGAPGLTWLMDDYVDNLSYLDLLEMIQGADDLELCIEKILPFIKKNTIKIETDMMTVEHFFLPTYRYIEQLLDLYTSPETIVEGYKKKYIIAEVLSELGKKLGVGAVLVDLKAGLSEFSSPLLFDPRVKKYLVTSTSYQSTKGMEIILKQLNKGVKVSETGLLPEVFLTMIPPVMSEEEISEIKSQLLENYSTNLEDDSRVDNIILELPFASELIHLKSMDQIMSLLNSREVYQKIYRLIQDNYYIEENNVYQNERERQEILKKINRCADRQIVAETNEELRMLMTESINNLVRQNDNKQPVCIIMGAKGSGKTFLFRELLRHKRWECFLQSMGDEKKYSGTIHIVPILASSTRTGIRTLIVSAIQDFNHNNKKLRIDDTVLDDNQQKIETYLREIHDKSDWFDFWRKLFSNSFREKGNTLEGINNELARDNRKVLFIIDGLEEIFSNVSGDKSQQIAIEVLCKSFINEIQSTYKNIGVIVFLRKDLANSAIKVNFTQFNQMYAPFELKWSGTEALRLALWLVYQVSDKFYLQNEIPIETATKEVLEKHLEMLWGKKLGRPNSNEAYSASWVIAALSDFNGQLQARDIIRFLKYATSTSGRQTYLDRYIMPTEIKKAVPPCSQDKVMEIKQENHALASIFEKLIAIPEEYRVIPLQREVLALEGKEETLMQNEGFLTSDKDKLYMPEIIRHALGFKYAKGARPKVLSLMSKNRKTN